RSGNRAIRSSVSSMAPLGSLTDPVRSLPRIRGGIGGADSGGVVWIPPPHAEAERSGSSLPDVYPC
ncbi:MAG: hypothetical protein M0T83_07490, partial [Nitrospiraceae bacterium]|nr:hypothetical protein [Nitrospiraceae bacterium]